MRVAVFMAAIVMNIAVTAPGAVALAVAVGDALVSLVAVSHSQAQATPLMMIATAPNT